jgi:hypothetical protein
MTLDDIIAILDKAGTSGRATKQGRQLASACIEKRNASTTFVLDNPKGVRIFDDPISGTPSDLYLLVQNPNGGEIAFWKYDGCFMQRGGKDQRCDLALMTTRKIAFIEMKLSAYSASLSKILENRADGLEQLETSYRRLRQEFLDANEKWPFPIVLAYLVTPAHYPNVSPLSQDEIYRFETDLGIELQEANPITFP